MRYLEVAAIAPWFCLRLPSCGPGFKSQAHQLRFFQFVFLKLYWENDENKQKEAGIGPFFWKKDEISKDKDIYWKISRSDKQVRITMADVLVSEIDRRI